MGKRHPGGTFIAATPDPCRKKYGEKKEAFKMSIIQAQVTYSEKVTQK